MYVHVHVHVPVPGLANPEFSGTVRSAGSIYPRYFWNYSLMKLPYNFYNEGMQWVFAGYIILPA